MKKSSPHISIITHSPEETVKLGQYLGNMLEPGNIVALIGDLGAGKTWLSRGIGDGLGISEQHHVHSPAFDLIHEHPGPTPMYHMDFYRLDDFSAEDEMWVSEYIHANTGVCVIEWANKYILDILEYYLMIQLSLIENCHTERKIDFYAIGDHYLPILNQIEADFNQSKETNNIC
jgi:tRNA threonylcarbamoyladenosine biosynthesis protein TsaE